MLIIYIIEKIKSGTKDKPEISNAKDHIAYKNWENSMNNLERKNIAYQSRHSY